MVFLHCESSGQERVVIWEVTGVTLLAQPQNESGIVVTDTDPSCAQDQMEDK